MCIGISAIALQRGNNKLLFKSGINSHEKIRDAFGISDYRTNEQVNLEARPTGDFIADPWKIRIDHDEGGVPQWFLDKQKLIESNFMEFVEREILEIKKTNKYNGYLDLSGCTGLTSIPALTADKINLSGCTGIKRESIPKGIIDKCIF